MSKKHTPILLLPFVLIWNILELILKMTGRFMAVILGLAIIIIGVVLCITVIGAVVGIPLILFGSMMMLRGFF
jgi:hypothetical protein